MEKLREQLAKAEIAAESLTLMVTIEGHPYYKLKSKAGDAFALWHKLREISNFTGYLPVILGDVRSMEFLATQQPSVAEIIENSKSIQIDAWIKDWREQRVRDYADDEMPDDLLECSVTDMPDTPEPANDFYTLKKKHDTVLIGLIPTTNTAHISAFLKFGGWNDCPAPEVQVAFHSYWYERYGAEIVVIADDVIECFVSRPPRTASDALSLAKEQYAFCSDIVEQGTQTVPALATGLWEATRWFFWWD